MKDWSYLTTQDIATLGGVGQATVRVWRHRFKDFPRPVRVVGRAGLYAPDAIVAWLINHDRSREE